jgi:uncharacterized protein (DUF488 family)
LHPTSSLLDHALHHRPFHALGIQRLVDVRTVPRSRQNPQFNRENLARFIPAAGLVYQHAPALGGLRKPRPDSPNGAWTVGGFRGYADYALTQPFKVALDSLLVEASAQPTTVMCAEAVYWRCHRRIIADWALARGDTVIHILAKGRSEPAALTPFARLVGDEVRYPGLA